MGVDTIFEPVKSYLVKVATLRFLVLGTCAVLLSAASAFSFLSYMGQGIVVGALLGLRGREADVAAAQRWAVLWLGASCACFAGSSVTAALVSPLDPDEPRVARFLVRLVVSATLSILLTALIGWAAFSIITASRHSVVH
jgi:hypothetical protein